MRYPLVAVLLIVACGPDRSGLPAGALVIGDACSPRVTGCGYDLANKGLAVPLVCENGTWRGLAFCPENQSCAADADGPYCLVATKKRRFAVKDSPCSSTAGLTACDIDSPADALYCDTTLSPNWTRTGASGATACP